MSKQSSLLVDSSNVHIDWGLKARSQEHNPNLLHRQEEPSYLSHEHCFPVSTLSGNQSEDPKPRTELKYSEMGCAVLNC